MMASVPQAINQRYAIPPSSKIAQLAGREPLSPPSSTHSVAEVEFEVKKDTITKAAEELTKTVSKNGSLPQAANRDAALDTLDTSYRAPSRAGSSTSRKKRLYYSEAFAVRDGGPPIPKTAGVLVELKTNVILDNEFEFAKSLSEVIAKRFSRTEESVAVSIDHSCCMILGGTFDGSYLLTITSLTSISPTCNKRNAALIAEWINVNLGVPGVRGYIRFVEPDIANYATGGYTFLDIMEKEEIERTGGSRASVHRDKKDKDASIKKSVHRQRSKSQMDNRSVQEKPSRQSLSSRNSFNGDRVPSLRSIKEEKSEKKEKRDRKRSSRADTPVSEKGEVVRPDSRMRKKSIFSLFTRDR